MANYSCKKFSPRPYLLATIHLLPTDGQTDGQTDKRMTTMTIVRPFLKYGRLKIAIFKN